MFQNRVVKMIQNPNIGVVISRPIHIDTFTLDDSSWPGSGYYDWTCAVSADFLFPTSPDPLIIYSMSDATYKPYATSISIYDGSNPLNYSGTIQNISYVYYYGEHLATRIYYGQVWKQMSDGLVWHTPVPGNQGYPGENPYTVHTVSQLIGIYRYAYTNLSYQPGGGGAAWTGSCVIPAIDAICQMGWSYN